MKRKEMENLILSTLEDNNEIGSELIEVVRDNFCACIDGIESEVQRIKNSLDSITSISDLGNIEECRDALLELENKLY